MDAFRKEYRPLSESEIAKLGSIKDKAQELSDLIWQTPVMTGPSHKLDQLNAAQARLEECVMWATKAITG